jgi:hypothetical protein
LPFLVFTLSSVDERPSKTQAVLSSLSTKLLAQSQVMERTNPDMRRQELSAGEELVTSVEVRGVRAHFEVRTTNAVYQQRLEHMGYHRESETQFTRNLSATGDVLRIHRNLAHHLEEILRQSARMIPIDWEQALTEFLDRVDGVRLDWFLYGSGALAVRGIDVDPGDLDFWVSDAYLVGGIFDDLLVEPVTEMAGWVADSGGRAFLGCLFEWIAGVHPEVDDPAPHEQGLVAASRLETAHWHGRNVPVAPLDLQLAVAHRRGLHDRVAKIRAATTS